MRQEASPLSDASKPGTQPDKDFGILTTSDRFRKRCDQVCDEFSYYPEHWNDLDSFLASKPQADFIVAFLPAAENTAAIPAAELAQAIRYTAPDAFVVCVIGNSLKQDEAVFAKKSGANLILLEDEVYSTGKLEFIATQVLKSRYMPIKAIDLAAGKAIPFDLFHLMTQRKKFLRIATKGDLIDEAKIKKAIAVGEFYFKRDDGQAFDQYVKENTDSSAAGIIKRCRSQFLALFSGFSKLVFQLTDQSSAGSFGDGQALLTQCTKMCADLLGTLAESGKAWEVINNSAIGEMGSVERAPAIAAYAGVFALQMGFDNVDQLMLAAMLSDLGLLFLTPEILRKIRMGETNQFSAEERALYESYPNKTLQVCLDRKLSLPEKLRQTLLATHERVDGKGFPKKLSELKISQEAQMISFARDFDRETLLVMGKARVNPEQVLKEMVSRELAQPGRFGTSFLENLRSIS